MKEQWGAQNAGRAPLFDRLIDEAPGEPREATPLRIYGMTEVYQSIRRELERLLSTRCPALGDAVLSGPRTVLDYGLPDLEWGGREVARGDERRRMERLLRSSIEAFEPRLKGVKVAVSKKAGDVGRIRVSVSGVLTLENVREPLSFALVLSGAGATVAE